MVEPLSTAADLVTVSHRRPRTLTTTDLALDAGPASAKNEVKIGKPELGSLVRTMAHQGAIRLVGPVV